MLNAKNRIAEIEQEFLQLNPEQHYFEEYYATYSDAPTESLDKLSSQKILALWMEFEQHAERETRLGLLQKLSIMFRFNRNALKLFLRSPELVIPYLQHQFYSVKRGELEAEKRELTRKLEHYLAHRAQGRPLQRDPHPYDKSGKYNQAKHGPNDSPLGKRRTISQPCPTYPAK